MKQIEFEFMKKWREEVIMPSKNICLDDFYGNEFSNNIDIIFEEINESSVLHFFDHWSQLIQDYNQLDCHPYLCSCGEIINKDIELPLEEDDKED